MKKALILAMAMVMLAGFTAYTQTTSVPPLISYQGMLTDADGKPMTGTKKLTFNIYDSATGTTVVWVPQVFDSVPLIGGRFSVILGTTTDTAGRSITGAFSSGTRYLGITVDTSAEIAPRQQILSTPFAMQSAKADYATKAGSATNADYATKAGNATNADYAKSAGSVAGLPPADYDSGWFSVNKDSQYQKTYSLNSLPRLAVIWGASDSSGNQMVLIDRTLDTNQVGCILKDITKTGCVVATGKQAALTVSMINGYARVLMWK